MIKPWCIFFRLCTSATIFARRRATPRVSQNRRTNEHVITRACTYLLYNIIIFYYYQRLLNLSICTNNKIPFARENLSHRPPGMWFYSDIYYSTYYPYYIRYNIILYVSYFGFSEVKRINDKFICLEPIISEKTEGRAGDSETTSF